MQKGGMFAKLNEITPSSSFNGYNNNNSEKSQSNSIIDKEGASKYLNYTVSSPIQVQQSLSNSSSSSYYDHNNNNSSEDRIRKFDSLLESEIAMLYKVEKRKFKSSKINQSWNNNYDDESDYDEDEIFSLEL